MSESTAVPVESPVDPNIEAAHGKDPNFLHWLGYPMPAVVQARGIVSAGQWRAPQVTVSDHEGYPQNRAWRTCGYCGSIHPEELLGYIERRENGHAEMADRKYGYPHKIYVDLPNPLAGQMTVRGSTSQMVAGGKIVTTPHAPTTEPPYVAVKFYTRHLLGLNEEAFAKLTDWIQRETAYRFERTDGVMQWCRALWPDHCLPNPSVR